MALEEFFKLSQVVAVSLLAGCNSIIWPDGDLDFSGTHDAAASTCLGAPFVDDFEAGPSPALWDLFSSNATVDYDGGTLGLTFVPTPALNVSLRSKHALDMRGRRVWLRIDTPPRADTGTKLQFALESSASVGFYMELISGSLAGYHRASQADAPSYDFNNVPFDLSKHAYLQIRDDGSELHFETSGDGTHFIEQGTVSSPQLASLDAIDVQVFVWGGSSSQTEVVRLDAVGGTACN